MSTTAIKTPYYYIIKVVVNKSSRSSKTFYKIGETVISAKRPNDLVCKYEKYRANTAEIILFEALPIFKDKRIKDKQIHKALVASGKFVKANEFEVESTIGERDGKSEFFETTMSDSQVIDAVKDTVARLSQDTKNYTAKVYYYDNRLSYDPAKKHLVDNHLITNILEQFHTVYDILYVNRGSVILLVGQFLPDFVASFAMMNKVIIWHDTKDQKYTYDYERINRNITYIETMEDLINLNLNFIDLIIANPPYGKAGADITKTIIDNIDYVEYINLLPVNDYKRAKDLYKHAELSSMLPIKKGFADAVVTTHIARICKQPSSISMEEFEIANYIDNSLKKYFFELRTRKHYAIDKANCPYWHNGHEALSNLTTFILGERDISSGRFPTNPNSVTYKWNVVKTATPADLHIATNHQLSQIICKFNTEQECENFTNFCYSNVWFMNKLFKAVNVDKMKVLYKVFPKVDWTRPWTVEEILADYGYTQSEIDEVMADLVNYKGMED